MLEFEYPTLARKRPARDYGPRVLALRGDSGCRRGARCRRREPSTPGAGRRIGRRRCAWYAGYRVPSDCAKPRHFLYPT